jgi:hypothetical protein
MKKLLYSSLLFLTIIFSGNLKAQTTITSWVSDSTIYYCPLPAASGLSGYGNTTGYNDLTDNITVQVFWGDGTDTTFICDLYDGGAITDYYFISANHNYYLAGTYSPMVISTGPDGNDDTTYCNSITFSTGCVLLDGYTYRDNNTNCVFDAGDDTLKWVSFYVSDLLTSSTIAYGYSDGSGHYVISIPSSTNLHKIEPILSYSYSYNTVVCPASGSYTFVPTTGASFDFGLDCTTSGHELAIWANSWTDVPGGTTGFGYVYAHNISCNTVSGTITVNLDPNVVFAGMIAGPAPTTITGSTLTWNFTFTPWPATGSYDYLKFNLTTLTTAPVLGTACFSASVDPVAGDLNPLNNSISWCDIIGGPYDPNNKEVMPAGIGASGDVAPDTDFDYLINFQNCGTAEAINIYIMDTISSNLDMSTFQITGSSHSMTPIIRSGNIIRFDFPNIHLIDSVANEPLSHGWLSYHIKAKSGLANGTEIENTAHIYFDYNPAVVTNTTLNTIDISLDVDEEVNASMSNVLFPNPATNMVTVQFENNVSGNFILIDVTGKQVKSMNVNNAKEIQISLQELPSGFYGLMMPGVQLKQNRLQVIK